MNLEIKQSTDHEGDLFQDLLLQPDVLEYFPMYDLREIEDSIRIWKIFCHKGASLTAWVDGAPCGLAFLNLQAYKKLMHQCLITIVVDQDYRNKGIGSKLLEQLFILAKDTFHLESVHLEVYETNPAISLYKRKGFIQFGYHKHFIKEDGRYIGKILMEKSLL